ncbi:amidohydrolase family protein [Nakamurella lactea]|uniref:amidohydrolase family protein n=1 Tax=Nakamurella lactea TaxID=459515 RepID=UPI00041D48C7|nr:amidohydrolase family protein [Nakamurella lactea]
MPITEKSAATKDAASGPAAGQRAPSVIDAHVHVWDLGGGPFGVEYPWLRPELSRLYRSYSLADAHPEFEAAGVGGLVLVQAADSLAETRELLRAAAAESLPTKVVGWLPLSDPTATAAALQQFSSAELVGARHLIHDEPDPRWLLRPDVTDGLTVLAEAGLPFDAVAERPDLIAQIPAVARRHPGLTIVLDHLGKPPIADRGWQPWADLVAAAAAEPGVVAKISGLGTASAAGWTADDWQRYVDFAIEVFGPDRLMLGGDWPIALQAGSYADTWAATLSVIDGLDPAGRAAVLGGTAARVYRF